MQFTADDVKVHSIHQKWIRQLLSSNTVLPMLSSPSRTTQKIHRKSIINALLSVPLHSLLHYLKLALVLDIDEYDRKYSLGSNAKRAKQENPLQKALLLLIFQNLVKQQEAFLAFKVEDCMFTYFQCLVNFPRGILKKVASYMHTVYKKYLLQAPFNSCKRKWPFSSSFMQPDNYHLLPFREAMGKKSFPAAMPFV